LYGIVVGFTSTYATKLIAAKAVGSISTDDEVYSIQLHVNCI